MKCLPARTPIQRILPTIAPRQLPRLRSRFARQNLADDRRTIVSLPGWAGIVLGERSALRVDKLRLGGLKIPFACAPLGGADVYLNIFRCVLAEQKSLRPGISLFGMPWANRANRNERKSGKSDRERPRN